MARVSDRNGVPDSASRRGAGSKARPHRLAPGPVVARVVDLVEDHERLRGRDGPQRVGARRHLLVGGDDAVDVGGQPAAVGDQRGSRCRPKRAAASAHWSLRCEVGATTTSRRPGLAAMSCTAAHRAKVVLPAPGVATARKSGASVPASRSRARFCQGRRRTLRAMGDADLGTRRGRGRTGSDGAAAAQAGGAAAAHGRVRRARPVAPGCRHGGSGRMGRGPARDRPHRLPYAPEALDRKPDVGAEGFFAVDMRAGRVTAGRAVPRGPQAGVEAHRRLRPGGRHAAHQRAGHQLHGRRADGAASWSAP